VMTDRSPSTLLSKLVEDAVNMKDCTEEIMQVVREYLVGSGRESHLSPNFLLALTATLSSVNIQRLAAPGALTWHWPRR